MDGFKNSTKTSYDTASGRKFANGGMTVSRNDMADGQGPMSKPAMVAKYAKGGSVKKGEQKIGRVMKEFTEGKLHSGSKEGPKVKSTKQAVAIALNEARAAGAKIPRVKKAFGGEVDDVLMARMTKEELAQGAKGVKMAQERLERKSVKRGVPPSSDKPLISPETMREIRGRAKIESAGVAPPIRKAMGGMTLSNVPRSQNLTLSNVAGSPKRGMTLSSTAPVKRGLTLGMNKGGLSVMPKGKKGC